MGIISLDEWTMANTGSSSTSSNQRKAGGASVPLVAAASSRNIDGSFKSNASNELLSMLKRGTSTTPATSGNSLLLGALLEGKGTKKDTVEIPVEDNYAILGLAGIIRKAHCDRMSLALGVDSELLVGGAAFSKLASEGKDGSPVLLSKMMESPWAISAANSSDFGTIGTGAFVGCAHGLDQILPLCYTVPNVPKADERMGTFQDETLFYIFYSMPHDRLQELAARELTVNRKWRYHTAEGFWFQPESKSNSSSASHLADGMFNLSISSAESSSSSPSASTRSAVGDRNACSYIIFDSSCWAKVRKERSAEITLDQMETRFL